MAMCLHEYVILLAKYSQHHPPDCVKGQWKEAMMKKCYLHSTKPHMISVAFKASLTKNIC